MPASHSIDYLKAHSHLPGPRGNLELLHSFASDATADLIDECLSYCTPDVSNSPEEFVAMCGIVGRAVQMRSQPRSALRALRPFASHSSWRIREAVAMGIQEVAEREPGPVIDLLRSWTEGAFEKRAVVAGLCEPKLLKSRETVREILQMLETITKEFVSIQGRLSDGQTALRKALAYGWSVALVPYPDIGKPLFERLVGDPDRHVAWIVKQNLGKKRLQKMDGEWVRRMAARM